MSHKSTMTDTAIEQFKSARIHLDDAAQALFSQLQRFEIENAQLRRRVAQLESENAALRGGDVGSGGVGADLPRSLSSSNPPSNRSSGIGGGHQQPQQLHSSQPPSAAPSGGLGSALSAPPPAVLHDMTPVMPPAQVRVRVALLVCFDGLNTLPMLAPLIPAELMNSNRRPEDFFLSATLETIQMRIPDPEELLGCDGVVILTETDTRAESTNFVKGCLAAVAPGTPVCVVIINRGGARVPVESAGLVSVGTARDTERPHAFRPAVSAWATQVADAVLAKRG